MKQYRALKSRAKVVTIGETEISTVDEFIYLGYLLRYDGNETPNLEMRFTKANAAFSCLQTFGVTRHIYHRNLRYGSSIASYILFICMQVKSGHSIIKLDVLFAHGIAGKCH